jgi:hypothetical protein
MMLHAADAMFGTFMQLSRLRLSPACIGVECFYASSDPLGVWPEVLLEYLIVLIDHERHDS